MYIKGHVSIQRIKAMHVCVKMMSKGSKEALTVLNCYSCYSSQKSRKWCSWLLCNTAYRVTQFVTHVKRVKSVLCIQWPLTPARREGYCVSLPSWGFSCSPLVSPRRQLLLSFLDLSTTRVIAGKTHSQSPILKTKRVFSNPVISYISYGKQSCILHTLTKTACLCKF